MDRELQLGPIAVSVPDSGEFSRVAAEAHPVRMHSPLPEDFLKERCSTQSIYYYQHMMESKS